MSNSERIARLGKIVTFNNNSGVTIATIVLVRYSGCTTTTTCKKLCWGGGVTEPVIVARLDKKT